MDGLCRVDVSVDGALVVAVERAGALPPQPGGPKCEADARGSMLLPCFVDMHTHIDKAHTCERSRNPTGSLHGADASTAADAAHWTAGEVEARMEFAVRCAHAHGTLALRTHLMSATEAQRSLAWSSFGALRERWRGRVALQGVALVTLSFFADAAAAERLAQDVAAAGGVLGAAVCCSDLGGLEGDVHTTCGAQLPFLLDSLFQLAARFGLDVDLHVDENGNEQSKGLAAVAAAAARCPGFATRLACGHCCALAAQPPDELAAALAAAARAGVTVVSLPLVNTWLQGRTHEPSTPLRRGVTLLHELAAAGVRVCLASDNTRDQFYGYGDGEGGLRVQQAVIPPPLSSPG